MIARLLKATLLELASWYPVVTLTGPRQSGKSTLVRAAFPTYAYVNLEDPATRARALTDPTGFIEDLSTPAIIDEAQNAPELMSAIQSALEGRRRVGSYILTGSQNFLLLKNIKQSLAGRAGIARLLPLEYREIMAATPLDGEEPGAVDEIIVRGGYPQLYATKIPTRMFYRNYIDTYVLRDVTGYLDVRDEQGFRSFVKACAARAGGLLNYADLSRDIGVSVPTLRSWLSILESSYLIRLLHPYSTNISKRLAKTPKLYFNDTGLLCHLLNIDSPQTLRESPHYGAVFENFIISEQLKRVYNRGEDPELFFYRDSNKVEVDLIDLDDDGFAVAAEIKSGKTYRREFSRHVRAVAGVIAPQPVKPIVIYGGEGAFHDGDVSVFGVREWLDR